MNWREAFRQQARSDNDIRLRLNNPLVPYSHRLHYLQMVTEKLAKSYTAPLSNTEYPKATHIVLVKFLRLLRAQPQVQTRLGYANGNHYQSYIDALLPVAERIQSLAPSAAGFTFPNPEYPWRNLHDGEIVAPCEHAFEVFNPALPEMAKFEKFLIAMLRIDV